MEQQEKRKALARAQKLADRVPGWLSAIPQDEFEYKEAAGKWSHKEILGHLIDSAAINHHRFIRAQFEDVPSISYDQVAWNKAGCYQQLEQEHLISFWASYNRHLIALMKQMPDELLTRHCSTGAGQSLTISALFTDYINHLEHHLRQILGAKTMIELVS